MVVCIIALVVLGFLSIFSAKYRSWARDAFKCFTQMVTLRPCDVGLEQKIKSRLTAKLLKKSPSTARFVYRNFKAISVVFVVVLFASAAFSAYSLYNLAVFGSCDPHSTECVFTPGEVTCESVMCTEEGCKCETLGCEEPVYTACEGDCDCIKNVCG